MKTFSLSVISTLLLLSCSSLPAPQAPGDSLVIGYFSMIFPGEYFDSALTTIDSNIELDFRDLTTGHWVLQFLNGGHFRFLARGGHTYELVNSRAHLENGSRTYIFGPRQIGLKIEPSPGKVLSLGRIQLTYTRSKDTFTFHPEVDYEIRSAGGFSGLSPGLASSMTRNVAAYDVSPSQTWDDTDLRTYMKKLDPSSPWLSRDIVHVAIATPSLAPQ